MSRSRRPAAVANGHRVRSAPPRYNNQADTGPAPDVDVDEDGQYVPVRIADGVPAPVDTEPLFYIGDRCYEVPVEVPVAVSLRAITLARRMTNAQMALWLIEQTVGDAVLLALADSAATREQINAIFVELGRKYLGQVESLTGNR